MTDIPSIDARSGGVLGSFPSATPADVVAACTRAAEAAPWLAALTRADRAQLLDALAGALEANADEVVGVADAETALGETRLRTELARTAYQLRFMGAVAVDGAYLGASIEAPATTPFGPTPDLRLTSVPLGPVAVFGASNFPLAFSAPGGDTASAIAAGCPVVVKAHSSHPATSFLIHRIFSDVLASRGAPAGVFQVVAGREAGTSLVSDPRIQAVGFTGSVAGGRALFDIACRREHPIPFYGELGSVNPLIVTPAAAAARGGEIGAGFADSMTLGTGQFCTKPGLLLVPHGNDNVKAALTARLTSVEPHAMLNASIAAEFLTGTSDLVEREVVTVLHEGLHLELAAAPVVIEVAASALEGPDAEALTREYFGPFALVVTYSSAEQLESVLAAFPPALTGSIHFGGDDDPDLPAAVAALARRSGRIVFDQYPTGVAVAWGMHHGGQYPSSTSGSTSVGANSIHRWIRPIAFQNAPQSVLPAELHDGPVDVPRRVDGTLTLGRGVATLSPQPKGRP